MSTALVGAACGLTAITPAHAQGIPVEQCGPTDQGEVTCTPDGNPYPTGISYSTPAQDPTRDPGLDLDAPVYDLTIHLTEGVAVEASDFYPGVSMIGYNDGAATLDAADGTSISSTGTGAIGVLGLTRNGDLTINTDSITASGRASAGIIANSSEGDIAIDSNTVAVDGNGSIGISANSYLGDVSISADEVTADGYYTGGLNVYAGGGDIAIDVGTVATTGGSVYGAGSTAIYARAIGGSMEIAADEVSTEAAYSYGINAVAFAPDSEVTIDAGNVSTEGFASVGLLVQGGTVDVDVDNVTTAGDYSYGAVVFSVGGDASLTSSGTIATSGANAAGVFMGAYYGGDAVVAVGDVSTEGANSPAIDAYSSDGDVIVTANSVTTAGDYSRGISASAPLGDVSVEVGSVETAGYASFGIFGNSNAGNVAIGAGDVATSGDQATGVLAISTSGDIDIAADSVSTTGYNSKGVTAVAFTGDIDLGIGTVATTGDYSAGLNIQATGAEGDATIAVDSISTDGVNAYGAQVIVGNSATIDIGEVTTTGTNSVGIFAATLGTGDVVINAGSVSVSGDRADGIVARTYEGDVIITAGDVSAVSDGSFAIAGVASYGGNVSIESTGSIEQAGDNAYGVYAYSSAGDSDVVVNDVSTTGDYSPAVYAIGVNSSVTVNGDVSTEGLASPAVVALGIGGNASVENNGSISTTGDYSTGVYAGAVGDVAVSGEGSVSTEGYASRGIDAYSIGGAISISAGDIATADDASQGIHAYATSFYDTGSVTIDVDSITTEGNRSDGIGALALGGDVTVTSTGTISTAGDNSFGTYAFSLLGDANVTVNDLSTSGDDSVGVQAYGYNASVTVNGDLSTSGTDGAYGFGSDGVQAIGSFGTAEVAVNGSVTTSGDYATAVFARSYYGTTVTNSGAIETSGQGANGVTASAVYGPAVVVNEGTVATSGESSAGIDVSGYDDVVVEGSGSTSTAGDFSVGISATTTYGVASVTTGSVTTTGEISTGINAYGTQGVDVAVGSVSTQGANSLGVLAGSYSDVSVSADSITTSGDDSDGIRAATFGAGSAITIAAGDVAVSGAGSNAINALGFGGAVSVDITGDVSAEQDHAIAIIAGDTADVSIASGASVSGALDSLHIDSTNGTTISNAGTILTRGGYAIAVTGGPAAITNSGTLSGRILLTDGDDTFDNSGIFRARRDSDFGDGDDTFNNSGTLFVPAVGGTASEVALLGLETFNNSGLVDLRNGVTGDVLSIDGDFTGSGSSALGLDISSGSSGTSVDLLEVGSAAGSTAVVLAPLGNLFTTPGVTIVQAGADSPASAFFVDPASAEIGFVGFEVTYDPDAFAYQLVGTPGSEVYRAAKAGEGAQTLWYRSADAIGAHLASVRDARWSGAEPQGGLWLEMLGGVDRRDETRAADFGSARTFDLGYSQDYFGGQIGYDFGSGGEGGATFGVTGGYLSSVMRFDTDATRFEYDAANVGLYAGFTSGSFFLNGLAKYDHYWIDAVSQAAGYRADLNGESYGAKVEGGLRFGSDKFFAEPVASIAYVRTDLDSLEALGQVVDYDDMSGLRGKAGLRLGGSSELDNGNTLGFYASASAVHEFEGEDGARFISGQDTFVIGNDPIGTYGQGTLGINVTTTTGITGFIEATGNYSDDYKGYGGRAGLRLKF